MLVFLRSFVAAIVVTALAWIAAGPACGQDSHYWSEQYGARSMLLCGAVIGGVNDMSAVFYNPGALGYLDKPELLLSANAYQLGRIKVTDGAGQGIDLKSRDFNPIPNLVAGVFKFNFYGRNKLAYSILMRHYFNASIEAVRVGKFDLDPSLPGDEVFAGKLGNSASVREIWVGLTWARRLSKRIGFGGTTFLSIRNQTNQNEFSAQAQAQNGDVAVRRELDNYGSSVQSLLWKAGLGFDFRPLTAGITVTTPNVRLGGSGTVSVNATSVGIDRDGDGTPDDGFITDVQPNVRANYKSPLSIGVGAGWHFGGTTLHAAAEWFAAVTAYDVLEVRTLVSESTGQPVSRSYQQKLDSVVNFGLGIEHEFGKTFSGTLGFNTDRSAFSSESDVAITPYDIYHVAAGGALKLETVELTLGLRYSSGKQTVTRFFGLNPGSSSAMLESSEDLVFDFNQLTFLFGFSLNI
jgi:hypothetical protein